MTYDEFYPAVEYLDMVDGIMLVGKEKKPCWNCGTPTRFIEINFEASLCSKECVAVKDKEYWEAVTSAPEDTADSWSK